MNYTNKCIKSGEFPTIEGLATVLGVGTRTIYDWETLHSEFSQTVDLLRDEQRRLLITNGLTGKYSSSFASFLLKAIHGLNDSKPLVNANQNNYLNIPPDLLADALEIIKVKDEQTSTASL